ncbi:hybrid signal transduction histidine kinase L, partial [Uranotaenia lowii]|uniref:hybrid signal transduction histidine kinase L n=1 Tax=Uranotaenia lowii TaxID=190385 RepID=UPI00247AD4E2
CHLIPQASLLSTLPVLLDQSHLTDVTLIAEGRNIKAHRVVLSACSSFFSELFRSLDGPPVYPVIVLPGASFQAVVALLTFMYSGEVNVYEEQISTLLSLAETLGIKGLADVSGNSQKSSTPTTETSSRESEIPSPYQGIKLESPGEPYFSRPFNLHSPFFPQALNLATHNSNANNNNNSSNNGNTHGVSNGSISSNNNNNTNSSNANKSAELFSRFLPQKCDMMPNEALWKMNEANEAINRDKKPGNNNSPSDSNLEDRQSVNANNKNNIGQASEKQNMARSDMVVDATCGNPKFNLDRSHHSLPDSAPTTPSSNPDEQRTHSSLNAVSTPTKKSTNQESKRKKIDKIAEDLRSQTTASAAVAAAALNKHLLQSLKFSPGAQSLSPLHLFSKPPTATPVSSQQPSFLAHHFLTNESASKTPESLILESSHPSPGGGLLNNLGDSPMPSSPCSSATTITPSMALDMAVGGGGSSISSNSMLKMGSVLGSSVPGGGPTNVPTKPYATCFICNKQLSNQYNLRVHLETHQNVRYACTVCSHVSRSKDALRKHVSYRHPGTPSPCDSDTKRKRTKTSANQTVVKQEMLTETSPVAQMIKQEILGDQSSILCSGQQQQQQQQPQQQQQQFQLTPAQHHLNNQLLANLTSQTNSIVSIPSFLQQAASIQNAFSSKTLQLFSTSSITSSLASQMPHLTLPCNNSNNNTTNNSSQITQPKDLSSGTTVSDPSNRSPTPMDVSKVNGSMESMDDTNIKDEEPKATTPVP